MTCFTNASSNFTLPSVAICVQCGVWVQGHAASDGRRQKRPPEPADTVAACTPS